LIHRAKEELEDVCEETMVPMPQLCPLLTIDDFEDENNKPVGKLSDALAKLKKTVFTSHTIGINLQSVLDRLMKRGS